MRLLRLSCAALAASAIFPALAFAQTAGASCPAYTDPGVVSVTLSTELVSTVPGVPVGVHAALANNSSEEVLDGSLYARVTDVSSESGVIVDEFIAVSEIDLAAGGSKEVDFIWQMPVGATRGDYRIETFFVYPRSLFIPPPSASSKDAAALTMHVDSDVPEITAIDISEIVVQGAEYSQETGGYVFAESANIAVEIPLKNRSGESYKGSVTWRLFERGKGPLTEPVGTYTEEIKMHPGGVTKTSYLIPDASAGSYYLEAELSDSFSTSLMAIPLLREGVCADKAAASGESSAGGGNTPWLIASALAIAALGLAVFRGWHVEKI